MMVLTIMLLQCIITGLWRGRSSGGGGSGCRIRALQLPESRSSRKALHFLPICIYICMYIHIIYTAVAVLIPVGRGRYADIYTVVVRAQLQVAGRMHIFNIIIVFSTAEARTR